MKHSAEVPTRECAPNDRVEDFGAIKKTELELCIINDTLSIQVSATILCLSNPIEVEKETYIIPSDYICKQMKDLLNDNLFADITIKCGNEEFKVHKAMLASQSPVFKRMFQSNMKEKSSNVLEICDMEPAVVSDMLEYLYAGKPLRINELAKDLLYAANKYELPLLFTMCENELILSLTVENVAEIISLADQYQASNLEKFCLKLIQSRSVEIYKSEGWKKLVSNSSSNLLPRIWKGKQSEPLIRILQTLKRNAGFLKDTSCKVSVIS